MTPRCKRRKGLEPLAFVHTAVNAPVPGEPGDVGLGLSVPPGREADQQRWLQCFLILGIANPRKLVVPDTLPGCRRSEVPGTETRPGQLGGAPLMGAEARLVLQAYSCHNLMETQKGEACILWIRL